MIQAAHLTGAAFFALQPLSTLTCTVRYNSTAMHLLAHSLQVPISMRSLYLLIFCLIWGFGLGSAPAWADRPPLSGKALTFQGFLVSDKGVPYGTTEPEVFYMRFSITSAEGGGSLLWQSLPKQVEVREGIFSVRLGQFTADEQPIDESIFTGNDAGNARRHLMMEISTAGTDGPWFGFFRKDLNPSLNDETAVESHIPIPAMPFTVSALRIQGPDIKEGSLRIVADPEDLSGTQPDLFLQTAQPLHGLSIFQNENIGIVIINPATTASLHPMALKLMGKSNVKGGLYLDGNESSINISGDLKSTAVDSGKLYLSQSTPDANATPAIETGKIHAAQYESSISRDYGISLTSTTTLRELIIHDTRRQGLSNLKIQSGNRAVIQINEGDMILAPSAILNISSLNFGEQIIRMGFDSEGMEAMGFYDREQLSPSTSWPYQMIPHGLSIMNTLTLGGQYALDYSYLKLLIGQTDVFGDTIRAGNALIPGTIDQPLHRHDLRAGSDPDALVDKLNEAIEPRIIRRRISDEVAWLYEPNNFQFDNYFNFTDGWGTPGVLTAGGLTARYETLNTFLRSDFSGMYLGAKASGIKDFYFYECSDMNNCPHPASSMPYLDLHFNQVNLSESVTVEGFANVLGDFYLNSTFDAPTFTNHLIYGINPALFTETNPMMHAVLGETNIVGSLILNLSPVLNSRLDIGDILIADRLLDSRNPTQYYLDAHSTSRLFSLVVDQNVKVNQDLEGWFLNSVPRINVFDSAQFSGVVTASIFKDVTNPSVFFIDPDGSINSTSLRRLTLTSDLYLEQQASVGGDFLSTADLSSQMDLILQTGGFVTDGDMYLNRFRDSNNLSFYTDLNNQTILNSLENIGSVTGQSLDSFSSTALLSMASNLQSQTLVALSTMSAVRFVDLDDSLFYIDANSASRVQSMVVNVFSGADALVRTSAYFLMPTTISGNTTISQTLSLGADIVHSGDIMVTNAGTIEFRLLESGDIVAARRLELTSGFLASSPDAVFVIRDGLNQYSTTDSNYLSNAIFHNDVYFLQTSLALGSSREAVLTSEGRLTTVGRIQSGSELKVGWNSLESSLVSSGSYLLLNSTQNSLVLTNDGSLNHLNLDAKDIRVSRILTGTNDLYTPIAYSDSAQFYLDPGSVSSIRSLTISSNGSLGGYLVLSAPLHFVRMQDRDNMALALDPSDATTITSLIFRSASIDSILTQSASQDETVFRIRDNAGNRIFELDNQLFWLNSDGHMHTSASIKSDGLALIKSDAGLIFSTASSSIQLTSQVLYLLAGKNGQYADSLHQHSEFYGIPLTSFMRRDINNQIASKQTLIASGLGLYLQPETVNSNLLFRQLNTASDTTLSMFADGQITASVLEGDGKLLTGVSGTSIRVNSISNEDLASNTIGSAQIADNAISGDRLKSFTVSQTHMIPSTITSREIAAEAILAQHFANQSLLEPSFFTGAIRGTHFQRAVIDNTLIALNTLSDSRFVTQAVTEGHILNDTITSVKLANDSIRIQHLTDNSINSSVIVSESLIDEDLAAASIGLSEIASLAINSYIVRDQNITRIKIADSAIDSSRILSRTLLSETFEDQSVTRDKIQSLTITSREIADLSLINENFQNQAITTIKLNDSAIRTRHITDSAIETNQILNDSVQTRNFATNTIGSSEILNLSLLNEDFIDNTLDPAHIQVESIEARHVRTKAVTAIKITPSGIDNRYFQPYTFQGDRIQNSAVDQSHLQANSVLFHHILSQTILAQDIADSVVHGQKIRDFGIVRSNLQTEGIGLHNVALDNILTRHFVPESLSSVHILTGSITTDRIADLSITSDKIIDLSLATDLFADNSAIASKFSANSIGTAQVSDASLIESNFAQNLVTSGKIKDLSLETANFLELSIQGEDIANRQLIGSQVVSEAVTEIKISTQIFLSRHFSPLVLSQPDYALSTLVNSAFSDASVAGYNIGTSEIFSNIIEDQSILRRSLSGTFVSTRTLAALTISSDAIIPFALTSRAIGDHQLVNENFVFESITRRAIGTGSIEGDLVTSFSIQAEKIASYSLDSLQFATDSVIHRTLKAGVIFTTNVLDLSLLEQKIATDTLTRRVFAPLSIESSHIISQSIDAPAFVVNAIAQTKLENVEILKERHLDQNTIEAAKISGTINASTFKSQSLSGSVFLANSIPSDRIIDFMIPGSALMDSAITTNQLLNNSLTEKHFVDQAIETASIGDAQILNVHLSTGIIQSIHIKDGSLGQLQVMTRSLETTKFETGALHFSNVANGSILSTNIAEMGIGGDRFQPDSITYIKVGTHTIYGPELAPKSFTGTLLANNSINSSHIGPRFYLDSSSIANAGIETPMLASDAIRPWHFPQNSLTTAKLGSIPGSKFQSHSLGSEKLAPNSVTGIKIMTEVLGDKDRPIYYVGSDQLIRHTWERDPGTVSWTNSGAQASRDLGRISLNPSGTHLARFLNDSENTLQSVSLSDGSTALIRKFPWPQARSGHSLLKLGANFYVIGGWDPGSATCYSDVWRSTDGEAWEKIYNGGFFRSTISGGHCLHGAGGAVIDNKLVLVGGCTTNQDAMGCNASNQISYSTDGITWNRNNLVADAVEHKVAYGSVANDGSKLLYFGGVRQGNVSNRIYVSNGAGLVWSVQVHNTPAFYADGFTMLFNQGDLTMQSKNFAPTFSAVGGSSYADTRFSNDGSQEFVFGGGRSLQSPAQINWNFHAGDFTWEAWIKPSGIGGTQRIFSVSDGGTALMNFGINDGDYRIRASPDPGGAALTTNLGAIDDVWQHVAVTKDGTTIRIFLNGTKASADLSLASTPMVNISTQPFIIGADSGGGYPFLGSIDSIRMVKTALYTADFTPPNWLDGGIGGPELPALMQPTLNYANGYFVMAGGRDASLVATSAIWFALASDPLRWYRAAKTLPTAFYGASSYVDGNIIHSMFGTGYANNSIALPPPHFETLTPTPTTGFNRHSHAVHFNGTTVSVFGGSENGTVTATSSYSNDNITWTNKHPIGRISSLNWVDDTPDQFSFLAQRGDETQQYTYDGTTVTRAIHAVSLNEFDRLDATNFVAVTTGQQIIYANNETFTGSTAVSPPNTYTNPRFHPSGNYIYAIRELGAGNHRLVRYQKTGTNFGPEENLNPGFAPDGSIAISGFEFEETGKFIYLNSNLSGSNYLHRISETGTGLTTLLATNQPGVIVRDGQAYNPYIPANTITSDSVMDSSLTSANLAAKTLVSVDFAAGGITTDSIPAGTLLDYHLGVGSLTRAKWETQSIPLVKFGANSFTNDKIANSTLSNRVLAEETLIGANIAPETFSDAQITPQTIGIDKLKSATFVASVLSQITTADVVDRTLDSTLFINLNSPAIALESLSTKKYRTGIFEGENILDGSIQAAQVLSASLMGVKLTTNLWQGNLISDNAIRPAKILDDSLVSANIGNSSVNTNNLSDANILSQHLMADSIESDNLPASVVNARTLAAGAITSSALGNAAIEASQFTARIVTGGNVAVNTIPGTKLASASLLTTHVDGFTLSDSDKIQSGSLSSRVMAIATISFPKLQSQPGANQLRTAAFEASGVSAIDSNKLGAQALEDYHFQPQVLTTAKIAANAVTSGKILDDSLGTRHFANNAFVNSNFAANSVTGGNIADAIVNDTFFVNGVIEANRFLDNSIRELSIETHSLLGNRINDGMITSGKIAPLTLINEDFANDSVTTGKIQLNIISSDAILSQTLTAAKIANNTLSADRFSALTSADFSGLTAADLTDNVFTGAVFRAGAVDGDRFTEDTITRGKLANGAIQTQNIENIGDAKIADESVTPAKISSISPIHGGKVSGMTRNSFVDGTIQGDRIALGTLGSGKFANNAVATADLANLVDLTGKITNNVLQNAKFVNGSINDSHLSLLISSAYTAKIADTSVTTQSLIAAPNFGSAKIADGTLSGDKLADDIISVFAANAVTAGKFDGSATGATTAKIQAGAVFGYHIENRAITEAKLSGTLNSSNIPTGGLSGTDFVNETLNNARFTDNTIPSNRLKNQVILDDAGFFSTVSIAQFQTLSPAQIANNIFQASDLGVGLTSQKVSNLSSANFLNNADADFLLADYSIANADLFSDSPVITNAAYINNAIRNSNVALGSVTAGNIAPNSFTSSKFKQGSIVSNHFNNLGIDSTDPTVNQVIDPVKGHTHSAYLFKRKAADYTGGYTLLQSGNFGRANFAYKLLGAGLTYTAANDACRTDKAMVCDMNQLVSICESGVDLDANPFLAANPMIYTASGTDGSTWTTTFTRVGRFNFTAGSCYTPTVMDAFKTSGLNRLTPIKVTDSGSPVRDSVFVNNTWYSIVDNELFSSANGFMGGGALSSSLKASSGIFVRPAASGSVCVIRSDDNSVRCSDNFDTSKDTGGVNPVKAAYFSDNSAIYAEDAVSNPRVSFRNAAHSAGSIRTLTGASIKAIHPRVISGTDYSAGVLMYKEGVEWEQKKADAASAVLPRIAFGTMASFGGNLYLVPAGASPNSRSLLRSPDGVTWTDVTPTGFNSATNVGVHIVSRTHQANASFSDLSSNNHTVTANGGVAHSLAQSINPPSSMYFDGSDDYLSVANDITLKPGTGPSTYEAWIYLASAKEHGLWGEQVDENRYWFFGVDSSGNVRFRRVDPGSPNVTRFDRTFTTGLQVEKWYHLAFTKVSPTGNTPQYRIYINGKSDASWTWTGSSINHQIPNLGQNLDIGRIRIGTNQHYLHGYIHSFRMAKSEVYPAATASNFNPHNFFEDNGGGTLKVAHNHLYHFDDGKIWRSSDVTTWNPVRMYPVDTNTRLQVLATKRLGIDSFADESNFNNRVASMGSVGFSDTEPIKENSSITLSGGAHLSIPVSAAFDFGTGNYTFEAWIKPTAGNTQVIYVSVSGSLVDIWVKPDMKIRCSGGIGDDLEGGTVSTTEWSHVACVRNGANKYLFLNGALVAEGGGANLGAVDNPILIGKWGTSDTYNFSGQIDGIRISNVARYTAAFDPPRTPILGVDGPDLVEFAGKMFAFGRDSIYESSNQGFTWKLVTADAPWTQRVIAQAFTFDNKLWFVGGRNGGYKKDVWYSSDGSGWTKATDTAPWPDYDWNCQAVVPGPAVGTDRLFVIGADTYKAVFKSANGVDWVDVRESTSLIAEQSNKHGACTTHVDPFDSVTKIYTFGGKRGAIDYNNDVWAAIPTSGTQYRNYSFSTTGNKLLNAVTLYEEDHASLMQCSNSDFCWVSETTAGNADADISRIRMNTPPSSLNPALEVTTGTSALWGTSIAGQDIVAMGSSTVAGSGAGNTKLFLLNNTGTLYGLNLNDQGGRKDGTTPYEVLTENFGSGVTFNKSDTRIHCKGGASNYTVISGLLRHSLLYQGEVSNSQAACCRQSLR